MRLTMVLPRLPSPMVLLRLPQRQDLTKRRSLTQRLPPRQRTLAWDWSHTALSLRLSTETSNAIDAAGCFC